MSEVGLKIVKVAKSSFAFTAGLFSERITEFNNFGAFLFGATVDGMYFYPHPIS